MYGLKELTALLRPRTLATIVADLDNAAHDVPETDLALHDMLKIARRDTMNTLVALVGHKEAEGMVTKARLGSATYPRHFSEED